MADTLLSNPNQMFISLYYIYSGTCKLVGFNPFFGGGVGSHPTVLRAWCWQDPRNQPYGVPVMEPEWTVLHARQVFCLLYSCSSSNFTNVFINIFCPSRDSQTVLLVIQCQSLKKYAFGSYSVQGMCWGSEFMQSKVTYVLNIWSQLSYFLILAPLNI